ncbi:hypothetical protein [Ketogulonicigenium vulgare]|uniref:hypothetical protein n=1 Tax=Ketogulonicigenium vulgare TaxID=92945 RepID=UPI001391C165|nr:hypothetical protein [Ketogulonicigenium vulgare]
MISHLQSDRVAELQVDQQTIDEDRNRTVEHNPRIPAGPALVAGQAQTRDTQTSRRTPTRIRRTHPSRQSPRGPRARSSTVERMTPAHANHVILKLSSLTTFVWGKNSLPQRRVWDCFIVFVWVTYAGHTNQIEV